MKIVECRYEPNRASVTLNLSQLDVLQYHIENRDLIKQVEDEIERNESELVMTLVNPCHFDGIFFNGYRMGDVGMYMRDCLFYI